MKPVRLSMRCEIHQGFFNETTRVMTRIEKEIRLVLTVPTAENDSAAGYAGALNWKAIVAVDPRGTGFTT